MAVFPDSFALTNEKLALVGLINFGAFLMDDGSIGILVGNAGQGMWEVFSNSLEYVDGQKDPMNRWTKRIISEIAKGAGCSTLYPFDRPFPPFQKFASSATGAKASPLGLLMHSEYGLWHAFRAVLVFSPHHPRFCEFEVLIHDAQKMNHLCDTCVEKPCLTACPANAFSTDGLDVNACFGHMDLGVEPDCKQSGCAARGACPFGSEYKYTPNQLRFHMKSYRGA